MKVNKLELKKLWLLAQNKRIEGQVDRETEHRWSVFALRITGLALLIIWSLVALTMSVTHLIEIIRR